MDDLTQLILSYRYYIEIFAVVAAVITVISSLDDIFVDVYYWCLRVFGNRNEVERERTLDFGMLDHAQERPFAIMVPTWKEHAVIFSMLGVSSRLLRYSNHQYFIGVYQNDPQTLEEVRRAQAHFPNIHIVMVPRNGPTSKADCLNEVISAIFRYELEHNVTFTGIALHDAEDLIHPHELKLFNYLIPTYDFVQLPVFSFNLPLRSFVAGTYMDEFAETHSKDLIVREHMSGVVPCAGVSACFSRRSLAILIENNHGEAFDTSSFTEDYDVAFRLAEIGLKTTFVSYPVEYTIDMDSSSDTPIFLPKTRPIATREFFPSELKAAYQQRARWILGIVFQGMASHGWGGSLGTKFFLMRDRKGILTATTVMLAYFVLANFVAIEIYFRYFQDGEFYRYQLLNDPLVIKLFILNFFFLVWRLVHRMYFTTKVYDLRHGFMAAPRLIVSNFINFFASVRAVRIYVWHRVSGKKLVWDKTAHSYPFKLDPVAPFAFKAPPEPTIRPQSGRRAANR